MIIKFLVKINAGLLLMAIISLLLTTINSSFIVFVTVAITAIIVIDLSVIMGYVVYKLLEILLN